MPGERWKAVATVAMMEDAPQELAVSQRGAGTRARSTTGTARLQQRYWSVARVELNA